MHAMLRPIAALSALLAAAAAQQTVIFPSNTTRYSGNTGFFLVTYCSGLLPIPLIPLTTSAVNNPPSSAPDGLSTLSPAGPNVSNPSQGTTTIAFIPCDPEPYASGNLDISTLVDDTIGHFSAILFYSLHDKYCDATQAPAGYPLYSTTSTQAARELVLRYNVAATMAKPAVNILPEYNLVNASEPTCNGSNLPKVQSVEPTTAFAMIMLYSVTGVITMLFLLIILTGAIRAHRNPDQYGPRNILGRPRQSRAKGIARAMLDTIPIVKFGEHSSGGKSVDVELTAATTPPVTTVTKELTETKEKETSADVSPTVPEPNPVIRPSAELVTEDGPAPVVPATGPSLTEQNENDIEMGLVCSICTEEFERGEDTRVLPCNHKYHPACVDPWLLNVSGTCPLCRIELCPPTSDGNGDADEDADGTGDASEAGLEGAEADAPAASRRRAIRTLLFERGRMQRATPEERIATLRRYREEQRARQRSNTGTSGSSSRHRPRYRSLRGPW